MVNKNKRRDNFFSIENYNNLKYIEWHASSMPYAIIGAAKHSKTEIVVRCLEIFAEQNICQFRWHVSDQPMFFQIFSLPISQSASEYMIAYMIKTSSSSRSHTSHRFLFFLLAYFFPAY